MRPDLDPVFLQARASLEERLDEAGFRVVREVFDHAAFGSAVIEYRRRNRWVRLTWDGKDRHLWLNAATTTNERQLPDPSSWRALDPEPPPGTPATFLRSGRIADERVRELLKQLDGLLL